VLKRGVTLCWRKCRKGISSQDRRGKEEKRGKSRCENFRSGQENNSEPVRCLIGFCISSACSNVARGGNPRGDAAGLKKSGAEKGHLFLQLLTEKGEDSRLAGKGGKGSRAAKKTVVPISTCFLKKKGDFSCRRGKKRRGELRLCGDCKEKETGGGCGPPQPTSLNTGAGRKGVIFREKGRKNEYASAGRRARASKLRTQRRGKRRCLLVGGEEEERASQRLGDAKSKLTLPIVQCH